MNNHLVVLFFACVALAVGALATVRPLQHGPKLTAAEFLAKRLTPETRTACPDVHAFATFARKVVRESPIIDDWRTAKYSGKTRRRYAASAAKTMAGELCSCRTWHKFPNGEAATIRIVRFPRPCSRARSRA